MTFRLSIVVALFFCLAATSTDLEKLSTEEIHELIASSDSLVMNFWATWCEPCVEEIPIFSKIQKNHKDVAVIGISMDELFIQDHSMTYRVALWTGNDFEQMVNSIDPKWDGPIPATFIFKKGKLVYSKTGPVTENEVLKKLE